MTMRPRFLLNGAVKGAVAVLGLAGALVGASPVPLSAPATSAAEEVCSQPYLPYLAVYSPIGDPNSGIGDGQAWPDEPAVNDVVLIPERLITGTATDTDGDGSVDRAELPLDGEIFVAEWTESADQVLITLTDGDGAVRTFQAPAAVAAVFADRAGRPALGVDEGRLFLLFNRSFQLAHKPMWLQVWWNLEDPCAVATPRPATTTTTVTAGPASPVPAPPPATSARPLPGTPSFTG
ncbi:MAG: hypothetical protein ABIP03_08925 [Aquihabitans sp.]